MLPNPFKPTAGKMPPILIGRNDVIDDFEEGLLNGAGAPSRLMLVSGQRGYGKTVLLVELARIAQKHGWEVVRQTASEGMCERIVLALERQRPRIASASIDPSLSIAGIASASVGSLTIERPSSLTVRTSIERRLRHLEPGKGILFTIDEAQAAQRDEMVALATAIQEVIGDEDLRDVPDTEKHGIAFVFAGLPSLVDDLVNDKVLTFLRRAARHQLGSISIPEIRNAYLATVSNAGAAMGMTDAQTAAEASEGYPYMIQLIGYYMWQSAQRRASSVISEEDVSVAIRDAQDVFLDAVCAPAYLGLTRAQQTFLDLMIEDWPNPSLVSDIARRAGKSRSWASAYRKSLIDACVITGDDYGLVSYAIPHFGEYLRTHRS